MIYIPKELEEERNRLIEEYLESDSEISVREFIEIYASEEYKSWAREWKKEVEEQKKRGIVI